MTIKALDALVSVPFDIFYCATPKRARKIQERIGAPVDFEPIEDCGACIQYAMGDGYRYAIVYMPVCLDNPAALEYSMLAHEAMHAWRHVRDFIGEDSPSKEFEAYAMQSISYGLFTAYEKARAKAEKKARKRAKVSR